MVVGGDPQIYIVMRIPCPFPYLGVITHTLGIAHLLAHRLIFSNLQDSADGIQKVISLRVFFHYN